MKFCKEEKICAYCAHSLCTFKIHSQQQISMKEMKKESALIAPTACAHSTKQQAQKMQGRIASTEDASRTASTEDAGPYSQHRRCRAVQQAQKMQGRTASTEDSRDSRKPGVSVYYQVCACTVPSNERDIQREDSRVK
jgi:hypothetical protein